MEHNKKYKIDYLQTGGDTEHSVVHVKCYVLTKKKNVTKIRYSKDYERKVSKKFLLSLSDKVSVKWEMMPYHGIDTLSLKISNKSLTMKQRDMLGISKNEECQITVEGNNIPNNYPIKGMNKGQMITFHRYISCNSCSAKPKKHGTIKFKAPSGAKKLIKIMAKRLIEKPTKKDIKQLTFTEPNKNWADMWGDHRGWTDIHIKYGVIQHGSDS